ncbi:hypothetical protein AY599_04795 [Leptolyngbya valderiana BDU 20041]|nr:hypothetical protein AY599_04795 [Leptolyngbya valderiana BDU 20041]
MQRGSTTRVGQDTSAVSGLAWVVGVCAVVLTAWLLGASWLTRSLLGAPAGLWIIGTVLGGRWCFGRAMASTPRRFGSAHLTEAGVDRDQFDEAEPATATVDEAATHTEAPALPSAVSLPRQLLAGTTESAVSIIRSCSGGQVPAWLERLREAGGTPGASLAVPLRIGVRLAEEHLVELKRVPGALDVLLVPFAGQGDASTWRRLGFDAVIEQRQPDGAVVIHVTESPDDPAAWHDWSLALPLSYSSLFPLRIDPARVTLASFDWSDAGAVAVLRSLLEVAALLGRYPSRLGFGDRLRGRPALGLMLGSPVVSDPALDRACSNLAGMLHQRQRDGIGDVDYAAMRVLAAYLSWTGCGMLPDERVAAARTIGRLGPTEGETCLRACVAAFAGGHEVLGFDLMLTGHERLSIERPEPLVDPMEYLISDISYNRGGAETLGKLAAGLAYATALIDRPRVAYVLDDVVDEVMTADWLTVNPETREQVLAMIEALSTVRSLAA